jgi:inner membrane transporter RhtA
VLLALVFGTMNLSLYTAIDRIGPGPAVTLEFLGPLSIALAASRRRVDACCAVIAAAGVVTLMRPRPSADFLGMGFGLLAAGCWASYILLNRTVGRRIPGAAGSAATAGLSALLFLPVGVSPSRSGILRRRRRSAAPWPPACCPPRCPASRTCSPCAASRPRRSVSS